MRLFSPLREFFQKGDTLLLSLCVASNLFGLVLIFSATNYMHTSRYVLVQAAAMCIGIVAYILLTFVDVERLVEKYWKGILAFNIFMIVILKFFGNDDGTGNKSWIKLPLIPFNLQPAEIVKITFILLLSYQIIRLQQRGNASSLSSVMQISVHTLLMVGLIAVISGDMGMVLVYLFLFLAITWSAGIKIRWFVLAGAACAGLGYLAWPHLPNYIRMRILVVFDHNLDPLDKGYHQLRSLLAIGSGQLTGQGFLQGTQTQNASESALFARHTDFIFSAAAEELGMLGCLAIIILLAAIVLRCLYVARSANSPFSAYLVMGFGSMIAVQTALNIGMCLFISPTVGLTLPFFSYGGSSIITTYAAMGLVSGAKMRSLPSWLRNQSG